MKRFVLIGALCLAGCNGLASIPVIPANPAVVANKTILDEQAATGAELAYKTFRVGLELATDLGKVKGDKAVKLRKINTDAYNLIKRERAAYNAANATDYNAALAELRSLINTGTDLLAR